VDLSFDNVKKHYLLSNNHFNNPEVTYLHYQTTLPEENSFISLGATLIPISIIMNYYQDGKEILIPDESFDFDPTCDCFEIFSGIDTSTTSKYLESTMTESGIGLPIVHDKYSYCHGRSTISTNYNNIAIYLNRNTELDNLLLKELPRYYKDTQDELMQNGFVTSIMGRRYKVAYKALFFPDQRQKYMRRIINFPVQSAASDIILCALCEIRDTFPQDVVKICATVHDSVIMLVKKNKDFHDNVLKIQSIMQHPKRVGSMLTVKWDVPLVADIECGPWGKGIDLEEYCEIHKEELEG
jgi:hypothetical protein